MEQPVVERARGILIERYGLTAHRALQRLLRVAEESRRPLEAIAADVVAARSGGLPSAAGAAAVDGRRLPEGGGWREGPVPLSQVERLGRIGEWEYSVTTGEIVWSPGMYAVLGRDPELGPLDAAASGWLEILPGGELLTLDQVVDIDGSERIVHVRAGAEHGPTGEVTRIVGIAQDVTELRGAEAELAQIRAELRESRAHVERDRSVVAAMQRAALPHPDQPAVAGLDIAARYIPTTGEPLGGDWYDVVPVGRRVWLSVGDVAGHGVDAAGAMAQLRNSARALVQTQPSPAAVLAALNRLALGIRSDLTATCVLGFVDLDTHRWCWAHAGHPPVVILGTEHRVLASPSGLMLGVHPHAEYVDADEVLAREETLLLASDGLYEQPGVPVDVSLRVLLDDLPHQSGPASVLCETIAAAQSGERRDDACILVARLAA